MKLSKRFLYLFFLITSSVFITSCGSDKKTQESSTSPSIFYANSAALQSIDTYAWGDNTYGNLGNGDDNANNKQTSPVLVTGDAAKGLVGVAVGGTHMLALGTNGLVYSWGNNAYGQLGNSSESVTATPVLVLNAESNAITNVIQVSAGLYHSLALVEDPVTKEKSVYAWGNNSYYQLATDAISSYSATPQYVASANSSTDVLKNTIKIAAGGAHNLVLTGGNKVLAWGYNYYGQLGDGLTATSYAMPKYVKKDPSNPTDLTNVTDIAAGGSHSLFLLDDGTVYACGYDHYGQLGIVNILTETIPAAVKVTGLTSGKAIQIAAGLDHSLALVDDGSGNKGTVWAWGYNYYGQLGNGTTTNSTIAVQVLKSDGTPLTNITKIVAIGHHSMAVDSSGQLWSWGDNTYGQLGIQTTTSSSYATGVWAMTNSTIYNPDPL